MSISLTKHYTYLMPLIPTRVTHTLNYLRHYQITVLFNRIQRRGSTIRFFFLNAQRKTMLLNRKIPTAIFCYSFLCTITNSVLPSHLVLGPESGPAQVHCAPQTDFPWLLRVKIWWKSPTQRLDQRIQTHYCQTNAIETTFTTAATS